MIVRINQIDLLHVETSAGWTGDGLDGPIGFGWPGATNAFEILVLETDERQQLLAAENRRAELRRMIPEVLIALQQPGEQIVVRLDGALLPGELPAAMEYLTDPSGAGRFAISPCQKL